MQCLGGFDYVNDEIIFGSLSFLAPSSHPHPFLSFLSVSCHITSLQPLIHMNIRFVHNISIQRKLFFKNLLQHHLFSQK